MARILIVEDDQKLARVASLHLTGEGHQVEMAYDLETAKLHLKEHNPEIVITDLMIGTDSGLDMLALARKEPQQPDVIFITAHANSETAAQAMKDGAYEYVTKPFSLVEIAALVKRIGERRQLVAENRKLREQMPVKKATTDHDFIVASQNMKDLLTKVKKVAGLTTTVLIRGASGTGKEEIARFIHRNSSNPNSPFIAINCGAIPENLLSSELFGHERGAYTGASARRAGAFERANNGLLFLDEMGEISMSTQVALLRVLETSEVTRVGGEKPFKVNVRLVAATHQNLEERVKDGLFREDLYYRINVFTARIPPLSERHDDIIPIARHFLQGFGMNMDTVSDEALSALHEYSWPGNVRELRNICENLWINSLDAPLTQEHVRHVLPSKPITRAKPGDKENTAAPTGQTLEEVETRQILEALKDCGNNKTKAAEKLGITRRRLYSRMNVLGIKDSDSDED